MGFDSNKLRQDMMDYYGTAMTAGNHMAMLDLIRAETAPPQELWEIASRSNLLTRSFENGPSEW